MSTERTCPHCGAVAVGEMKFCASCGKRMDAPPAPPVKKGIHPFLIIIGIVFGSCLALVLFANMNGGNRSTSGADPISAFVMCKQFVTDRLKSPTTAVFPTYSLDGTRVDQLSAKQFRAVAFVDSQNGFGATIRTQYSCTVTNTGGNNWKLDDLVTN
jgi:hypothetical protein